MCGSRENKDIWFYLFGTWNKGNGRRRWRGWDLFRLSWWRYREYILHDSFGKYWNRWVKCKLFGHKPHPTITTYDEYPRGYCFECEQPVGPRMLTRNKAVEISGQIWCQPETSDIEMDVRLAEAFADALMDLAKEVTK